MELHVQCSSFQGNDTLVDIYRVFTEAESKKRFKRKLRKERSRLGEENLSTQVEAEISKDVTLLVGRIGEYRAAAKIRWIDLCETALEQVDDNQREYRFYCLLRTNDVHGVSMNINWKSNEIKAKMLVSLAKVLLL